MKTKRAKLVLLGGAPGVGKTTLINSHLSQVLTCLDADTITAPNGPDTREQAISKVIHAAEFALRSSRVVLIAWVFAKPDLYAPFQTHFSAHVDVRQIYLVASRATLVRRLSLRGDSALAEYSMEKMKLINALPFDKVDTSNKASSDIAKEVLEKF